MGFLKEFHDFAVKGSAVDMAVGIVIGGAFGKIVASLVGDIVMPPIGLLLGKVDFTDLYFCLSGGPYPSLDAARKAGAPTINYGVFLNNIISFVIVAFCIFLVVRQLNRIREKLASEPTTKPCPQCLSTIPVKAKRCAFCTSEVP